MNKTENEMTDQELEDLENLRQEALLVDKWDKLELLRRLLNKSRTEQMYEIKRSSKLGRTCPYYRKSNRLFIEQEQQEILSIIKDILQEFQE